MLTEKFETEITVIVTAYNIEKYIGICLDELLRQSYQNFKVLVADDSSSDKTALIARDYAQRNPDKIRFITTPSNLGAPGLTRNFALDNVMREAGQRTKYLIFLDGDDHIEPTFLERLHARAEKTGADIILCAYDRVEERTGHILCKEMCFADTVIPHPASDSRIAFFNTAPWNKLIRFSALGSLRFPNIRFVDDVGFFFELCRNANTIATLNESLIHYQVRPGSGITRIDEDIIWTFAEDMQRRLIEAGRGEYYEILALATFIHIGISMPMRAFDNPAIKKQAFLTKVGAYLYANGLMKGRKFLSFPHLAGHGIKGLAICACRLLYRVHGMGIFLHLYDFVKRTFKKDFKF